MPETGTKAALLGAAKVTPPNLPAGEEFRDSENSERMGRMIMRVMVRKRNVIIILFCLVF